MQTVHVVGVVGDAEEFSLLKAGDAALFFHLTQCGEGDLFTLFLFPFWQVPQTVSEDEEVFPFGILYESAPCVYWGEGAAQVGECFPKIIGKNGYAQIFQIFVLLK